MHYLAQDALWTVRGLPYHELGTAQFLDSMVRKGQEHAERLSEYPQAQYDELEIYYVSLRGIAALDIWLLHDLLFEHGYCARTQAAWLAALAPHPLYRQPLSEASALTEHRRSAIELALAVADLGDGEIGNTESLIALARIRSALDPLPRPQLPLRLAPSPQQVQRLKEEQQRIGELYRRGGAQAARDSLPGTMTAYFQMSYPDWHRQGRPSLETYLASSQTRQP
ncbi:hypothetical protein IEQ11_14160 [Lysobacter capsici]|uniref:hypothetical protein n=1 Tax=Lysobacter capsici TaxID=435897 RepID=UPI0017871058|nr:hypothetical protein [Lysobacter capsici]UOF12904.1 hypothetical protein IEQ11_14160 [Lysobacter capsici]